MNNIPYELIARYLAGECNDDEKQQIQEWSQQHPEMMAEFTKIWQEIPSDEFNPDVEQALQNINYRINTNKKKFPRRLIIMLSGAAVAAIAAIFILTNVVKTQDQNILNGALTASLVNLNTGISETKEYQLPDGSKVWLNQSSKLIYPESFTNNIREVFLEGEAFFDITSDPNKPFIIHANNTMTRVVGTSFGVRAIKDADEVVVTVSTGIVNFSTGGKSQQVELKQGEQGVCKPEEQELKRNINPDPNSLAWKTKILVFKQSSLSEVAKVIENAYQTPITIDNSIAGLQLTSTFEQLSLEEIIQILEMTLQIKAEKQDNGFLLTI